MRWYVFLSILDTLPQLARRLYLSPLLNSGAFIMFCVWKVVSHVIRCFLSWHTQFFKSQKKKEFFFKNSRKNNVRASEMFWHWLSNAAFTKTNIYNQKPKTFYTILYVNINNERRLSVRNVHFGTWLVLSASFPSAAVTDCDSKSALWKAQDVTLITLFQNQEVKNRFSPNMSLFKGSWTHLINL